MNEGRESAIVFQQMSTSGVPCSDATPCHFCSQLAIFECVGWWQLAILLSCSGQLNGASPESNLNSVFQRRRGVSIQLHQKLLNSQLEHIVKKGRSQTRFNCLLENGTGDVPRWDSFTCFDIFDMFLGNGTVKQLNRRPPEKPPQQSPASFYSHSSSLEWTWNALCTALSSMANKSRYKEGENILSSARWSPQLVIKLTVLGPWINGSLWDYGGRVTC